MRTLDLSMMGEAQRLPVHRGFIAPAFIKRDHVVSLDPVIGATPRA